MHSPPTGRGPPGHVATSVVGEDCVTVATEHDTDPVVPTLAIVRPPPWMPANGSYSPAIPTAVMVQLEPRLTSHWWVNVAPRGASGLAMPTTRVMLALRPP